MYKSLHSISEPAHQDFFFLPSALSSPLPLLNGFITFRTSPWTQMCRLFRIYIFTLFWDSEGSETIGEEIRVCMTTKQLKPT